MALGTMVLGNNEIENCELALKIEGQEVFRLHKRLDDGQLVVDLDLRDLDDNKLVMIVKNQVIHCTPGLEPRSRPGRYEVVQKETGAILAAVEEVCPGKLWLTGTFSVNGWKVEVSPLGLMVDALVISHRMIKGSSNPVILDRDSGGIRCKVIPSGLVMGHGKYSRVKDLERRIREHERDCSYCHGGISPLPAKGGCGTMKWLRGCLEEARCGKDSQGLKAARRRKS